ncbi:MAG TPA: SDR family oxidoreductase [Acidisarcina sp.]
MAPVALSLEGKVALITGGSRGIGAETVRLFTAAGARVAFNYRVAADRAHALVAECGAALGAPGQCVAIQQELSSPREGRTLVSKAVDAFGRLDCLIVNHGIWAPEEAPIGRMSEAQWSRTMAVNLDSVFGLVQAAVAQMQRQGRGLDSSSGFGAGEDGRNREAADKRSTGERTAGQRAFDETAEGAGLPHGAAGRQGAAGHIVLISSTAGQRGEAFHADYAVTKGALISLTKSLSSELARDGIYVNCVAPGWVETEMSAAVLTDPDARERAVADIPLGRAATAREVAGPVLFLCTSLAGFISGEVLNVNGGSVLAG